MENYAVLPVALQICLDDVAWHKGDDERAYGRPSRTGVPRAHSPLDYYAVNEVGRALNMKILAPLCLGEWDKDNLLRDEVGISWKPYTWDRASEIDYPMAEKYLEAAESSEYLEYAVHGLLHGNYDADGKQLNEQEYFVRRVRDGKAVCDPIPMDDLKRRLDIFFKIYDSWGFKKKIRTIVSPGGVSTSVTIDEMRDFAREFKSRGLKYWTNGWYQIPRSHHLLEGVLCMRESGGGLVPWNAYDFDPATLGDVADNIVSTKRSVFGMHWPNFFRFNPERYLDHKDAWVDFFMRQAETFGLMLSRDIAFAANQELHATYATVREEADVCTVDLSALGAMPRDLVGNTFYLSLKRDRVPRLCRGGTMRVYEEKRDFVTYEICYTDNSIDLVF